MKKNYLIKRRMYPREIMRRGRTVKFFDKSVRIIKNENVYFPLYKRSISIKNCYEQIKNVRNDQGIIIAKRRHPGGSLWCTNQAYPPLIKHTQFLRKDSED